MCDYNSQIFEHEIDELETTTNNFQKTKTHPDASNLVEQNCISTEDDDEDTVADEPLWSIDDDTLFRPCGLINYNPGKGKSMFVTWSETYMLNFSFRKCKKTQRVNMTRSKISIPGCSDEFMTRQPPSQVREVHILEYNTLLLMSNGLVYYFSSSKSVYPISWLSGVRCFSKSHSGFSIIRHNELENRLMLEVYSDTINLGKSDHGTMQHSFDITYDEQNIFNCEWHDERFTLLTHMVETQNKRFLQQLLGNKFELIVGQQLHLFSVSGHFFALIAGEHDATQYHIELLCIYATNILFVELLPQQNLILIFLSCGTIDIWYISSCIGMIQRQTYHTGTKYLHYDVNRTNGDLYFTDNEQLVRLHFQYNATTDDCRVLEEFKPIAGMIVCSWVEHIQQLICLSSNNIFYNIDFQTVEEKTSIEKSIETSLCELTPSAINQLYAKSHVVQELMDLPAKLHVDIENEFLKQQLIAVSKKSEMYSKLCEANICYCRQLPAFDGETDTVLFYINTSNVLLNNNNVYALIEIKLHKNDIFQAASMWQLIVQQQQQYAAHSLQLLHIPIDLFLKKRCIIVISLQTRQNCQLIDFDLKLITFVQFNAQFRGILLPVKIMKSAETYKQLFCSRTRALNCFNEISINDLVVKFNRQQGKISCTNGEVGISRSRSSTSYKFKLPDKCAFEQVCLIFNACQKNVIDLEQADDVFITRFVNNSVIKFMYNLNNHCLTIESVDAAALLYAKMHLLLYLSNSTIAGEVLTIDERKSQLSFIMQIQTELETSHGHLNTDDDLPMDEEIMCVKNLHKIYHDMRSDLLYYFQT